MSGLVGLVVDVSGSMKESIRNAGGVDLSRLRGLRDALRKARRTRSDNGAALPARDTLLFAYVFGLNNFPAAACDVLTLQRVAADLRRNSGNPYKRLEKLASDYGLTGWLPWVKVNLSDAKVRSLVLVLEADPEGAKRLATVLPTSSFVQQRAVGGGSALSDPRGAISAAWHKREYEARGRKAEDMIHKMIASVGRVVAKRLDSVGDTTLPLSDAIDLLDSLGESSDAIDSFLYGNTPMCAALALMGDRFARESCRHPDLGDKVAFVVSDGRPTDGDPQREFQRLKDQGVTIISCFITSRDITEPQALVCSTQPDWPDGADLMFAAASNLSQEHPYVTYLKRIGWRIDTGAKSFFQVNHSTVLEKVFSLLDL